MRLSLLRFSLFACAFSLLAGCGSSTKKVEVTGKITFPNNVKLTDTDSVAVEFLTDEKGKEGGTTTAKADGSFLMKVPPGKYKVAVMVQPYPGQKDSEKRTNEITQLLGKFDRKSSAMTHEVTGDEKQNVTIDLTKGTISK